MTSLQRVVLACVIATVTAVTGFVAPSGATSTPVTLHQRDSGRTVRLAVGDVVRVDLRAASGTAYRWVVVRGKHSSVFRIVSRRSFSTDPGVPGASYHTVWRLRGTAVGRGTFKVVLRSTVNGVVARSFTVHLRVLNPDVQQP